MSPLCNVTRALEQNSRLGIFPGKREEMPAATYLVRFMPRAAVGDTSFSFLSSRAFSAAAFSSATSFLAEELSAFFDALSTTSYKSTNQKMSTIPIK